ncbi:uncharacterized protein LOC125869923 [Solanum stenotomum]|uniref:uncharacterized protein LOC125869923 n=1 Tax=Solanum stenotomum TaxID=172797 RepID=UPI0020D1C69C|nr:uncharacterized protein LOC125869923 [Solanum stenotomum]
MPPQRAAEACPVRRNAEPQEQGVPNAPEVQPQIEITNVEFCEAIWMLRLVVTNQAGQRSENRQEVADTSSIHEFLSITPLRFTGSSVTEDLKTLLRSFRRMSLFVAGLSPMPSKEGKTPMLIGDMDITRLMIHVQQVEKDKKQKGPAPLAASEPTPKKKNEYNSHDFIAKPVYSQGSMDERGSNLPVCAKCGRNHSGMSHDGSTGCFKCSQNSHFLRECPKNK